ncbi:hypothetical protein HHI36_008280 [Cryptolaemus montrouzieri]|uniref:Uncharacterized protein n=1 Tax=Cryptolaemus montrouzieri TaxID=559131 RepID=A0ABD2MS88_9CUCU
MSMEDVLFVEHNSSHVVQYRKKEPLRIERVIPSSTISSSIYASIINFFQEVLLPHGYPDSVSSDYFEYQIWDTLQAFCSTITGSFTTRAILKGVGVGDAEASALSATITWILKDGSGMIGRILFAWWKGSKLDCDSKKWRLFADFLNDVAMAIELVVPYFSNKSMQILCITSTMKSIVGIAGGATRASITHHQAIKGNMAEISAKDGTQETLVNLIASLTSIYLLGIILDPIFEYSFIFLMMILHLYFNYKAVTSLIFNNLNEPRMILLMKSYCNINTVSRPIQINQEESVILGTGLKISDICGFNIRLGSSLFECIRLYNFTEMEQLLELYRDDPYLIMSDIEKRCIYIAFEKNCDTQNILKSYFHAVMLALGTCIYNNLSIDIGVKRQRKYSNPIARLTSFMNSIQKQTEHLSNMRIAELKLFKNFVGPEINMFLTSLHVSGWDMNVHSFCLDQWRIVMKPYSGKNK